MKMKLVQVQSSLRLISFWGLCITAFISLGVSFVLFVSSVASGARFFVAFLSVMTSSAVQRYALAEAVMVLSSRHRRYSAILLETILGPWTHVTLAVVLVFKGRAMIAKNFLIGTMGMNHLLLLGACFMHGGHRIRRAQYALLTSIVHIRVVLISTTIAILPTAFVLGSGVSDGEAISVSRAAAIMLIAVFLCHASFICLINSDWISEANGLQVLLTGDVHDQLRHASPFTGEDLRSQQSALNTSRVEHPNAPMDSALNTGILLAFCIIVLCASFYLADSIPLNAKGLLSRPLISYIIAPLGASLAQYGAAWLNAYSHKAGHSTCDFMSASMALSVHITCLVLPLCVIAGWVTVSTNSVLLFDGFQAWFLISSVLLSSLQLHLHSDDWFTGMNLVALYLVFATATWWFPYETHM